MKRYIRLLGPLLGLLLVGVAWGQTNPGYTCETTSVNSATTPVVVMAPARITTWIFHTEAGATVSVDVFPYTGAVPATAPANHLEVSPGAYVHDSVTCDSPTCNDAIGQGWAAVLASGTTAVNFDSCSR